MMMIWSAHIWLFSINYFQSVACLFVMTGANGAGGDDFLSEKARKAERKIQAAPWDVSY